MSAVSRQAVVGIRVGKQAEIGQEPPFIC